MEEKIAKPNIIQYKFIRSNGFSADTSLVALNTESRTRRVADYLIRKKYDGYQSPEQSQESEQGSQFIYENEEPGGFLDFMAVSQPEATEQFMNDDIRDYLTEEDDELLITLVSQRPPLYDHRLPLKDRSREIIRNLWEEIISGLNLNISSQQVSNRWKNIRDSYLRARSNINKKIASGSSATEKERAELIKSKHKHFDSLIFLNETLAARKTTSNLTEDTPKSSEAQATPTSSKRKLDQSITDDRFFDKMEMLCAKTSSSDEHSLSGSHHICMRLAEGLKRLPRNIRNELEIDFLQQIVAAEKKYC